ncbi:MAG: hypothetical protein V1871_04925 [Planctomycetota bacterium]
MNIEDKLRIYNGYIHNSINRWKSQIKMDESLFQKILDNLIILNSREIRSLLRKVISNNRKLIESSNCYICKFGEEGKSGDVLIYEFRHAFKEYSKKIIEGWKISKLPSGSEIVFIDDLIGTGNQSVKHITDKLNQIMNPSHKGYLLCLCATPQGIKYVHDNTNIKVMPGYILEENQCQYLSGRCSVFSEEEKRFLKDINTRIDVNVNCYWSLGLLLAFYFTVPNNTLPFIWKHDVEYEHFDGVRKRWQALLPRDY